MIAASALLGRLTVRGADDKPTAMLTEDETAKVVSFDLDEGKS